MIGRWNYVWDAESRLIAMETYTNKVGTPVPAVRLEFAYDYMSRRVGKTVCEWNTASNDWQEVSASVFLYDGWNVTRSVTLSNDGAQTNFFTWGLDLSGSLQGAGGVGGLLSAVFGGTSSTSSVCYTYDGNGNVSELVDSGTGAILAHYEYSPFSETIVATGDLAKDNPFRFSTKYTDDETTLVYYGYRYYSPGFGRFVSRDPAGEHAGVNLYIAAIINSIEYLGLSGMQPWVDREIEARSVPVCHEKYGECYVVPDAKFSCDGAKGVASGFVRVTDYWYADNLGIINGHDTARAIRGAEEAHYRSAKALHSTLKNMVDQHNDTYSTVCACKEARDNFKYEAHVAGFEWDMHNEEGLETVHKRYAKMIRRHYNCP